MDRKNKDISVNQFYGLLNSAGFTLIEVMVSLIILAIGLLAIAGMQLIVIRANLASRNLTKAIFLAESKIEGLKETLQKNTEKVSQRITHKEPFFKNYCSITSNLSGSDNLKQLTITISWPDPGGDHKLSLDTLFSLL